MEFRPGLCSSRWEGLFATSWVVLLDVLLVTWSVRRPVGVITFLLLVATLLSLPVLFHLVYRCWGAFNLTYRLDRDALHIRWAGTHQTLPYTAIRCIVRKEEAGQGTPDDLIGRRSLLAWPCPHVRHYRRNGHPDIASYASQPLGECLLLETQDTTFALSPAHEESFLESLQAYNRLGAMHQFGLERRRPLHCFTDSLRSGPGRWLLLLGIAGVILLFGILMIQYPALPERLIFHYNSAGEPDSIRPKGALFLLPMIGALTFLVNGLTGVWMVCRQQMVGAHLLWGATVTVNLLVLLALVSLI